MSRKQRIKCMSSDELKAKLYSHFQRSGSLDHLRAQLRGQLVSELFKIAEPIVSDKYPNVSDVEKCILPLQVCNWLIYDHLSRQNYHYSLSTFVSEAQLPYPEKVLTAGDVLDLLGLKNTVDFEKISHMYSMNNELGFLHSLLLAIIKTKFYVSNEDTSTHTVHHDSGVINSKKIVQNGHKEFNQSFLQNKSEVAVGTSFQDFPQIKQMSLNKSFLTNDEERSVEMSFLKEFQSYKEENEKEIQMMRHRLLEELDSLHSEKRKMHQELEHAKSELKKEQNKLLKEKEILKENEVLLKKELTNEYEGKIRDLESEFAEKLHFKDKEIESLKRTLSEKDEKLSYMEIELASEKKGNNDLKQELNNFKTMHKGLQDKYSSLLDQNTSLHRKFENMSDYSVVKEELAIKSRKIIKLENEIKDLCQKTEVEKRKYVETIRNLENDLNVKEPQLAQAREEIEDLRITFEKEQALWNKERKRLESELREFKERNVSVMQKLKEKNEEVEELQQTNHFLNYKLTSSIIHTAKSESIGLNRMYQRPISNQANSSGMLFTKRNLPFQQQSNTDNDSKFKFFADKKNTYDTLKQEENKVRETYSMVFSSMPGYTKPISYLGDYNSSSFTKMNTNSYDAFSKPPFPSSSFNYDKSKLSTITKSPYSLNDVKRMVTHSLSPHKTNKHLHFQTDVNDFAASSQLSGTTETRPKGVWTSPKPNNCYGFHKQYHMTDVDDDTLTLITTRQRSYINNHNSTSENPLHLSSQNKNGEDHGVVSKSKEFNDEDNTDSGNRNELQKDNGNIENFRKNSFKPSTNQPLLDINKDTTQTLPESSKSVSQLENISNNDHAITTQAQGVSVESNLYMQNVLPKMVESQSSFFVNLDDAWKKRSSVTSLSYSKSRILDTNAKDRSDNSIYPSPSVPNNKTISNYEQHVFDKKLDKSKGANDESFVTINDDSAKNNSENASVSQQNRSELTDDHLEEPILHNKATENTDKSEYNTVNIPNQSQPFNKETKHNVKTDAEYPLAKMKQTGSSYEEVNKNDKISKECEDDDKKSSERTGNNSLSEQSEFHLSCGSDVEQQKEDSDAW